MTIKEYDSDLLIYFYKDNNLEFNNYNGYYGDNVKSYVLLIDDRIVGAITCSNYKNKNFIEALAVESSYRNKGYGKLLLHRIISTTTLPIYLIAKDDKFFLKYGFTYSSELLINDKCKSCKEYNKNCFPKVMVYYSIVR